MELTLAQRAQAARATNFTGQQAPEQSLAESVKSFPSSSGRAANLSVTKNKLPRKRRKRSNATLVQQLPTRSGRKRATTCAVHHEQIVGSNILPFTRSRRNHRRPVRGWDAPALPPFADNPMTDPNVISHFRDGGPAAEHVVEFHDVTIAGDGLSRQAVATVPVTDCTPARTIRRVGRARSPVKFNKDLAMRLKAARVGAGYDTQAPFAKALGIELERYKKWESGRTPIAHEYLAAACELTGKDANYFYGVPAVEQLMRRTGT
jgi:hypothetical protein